jgi:hypothetical protein
MDKGRIVGSAKEIRGSVKETIGKAVGDVKLQSESLFVDSTSLVCAISITIIG